MPGRASATGPRLRSAARGGRTDPRVTRDGRDIVVAEAETGRDGVARIRLPEGDYIVTGLEVPGLFGSPEPVTVTIAAAVTEVLVLTWDTGIR